MHRRSTALVLAAALSTAATVGAGGATAEPQAASAVARLRLAVSSAELAACFPRASATVTVQLTTDAVGKDTFVIVASGLQANTDFTVFLLQQAGPPFGAAEYIGDMSADRYGSASGRFQLIVEEAFALNLARSPRQTQLNSVGFWFADQRADDACLGTGSAVTPFDGDGRAGLQMMNSGAARLP